MPLIEGADSGRESVASTPWVFKRLNLSEEAGFRFREENTICFEMAGALGT